MFFEFQANVMHVFSKYMHTRSLPTLKKQYSPALKNNTHLYMHMHPMCTRFFVYPYLHTEKDYIQHSLFLAQALVHTLML